MREAVLLIERTSLNSTLTQALPNPDGTYTIVFSRRAEALELGFNGWPDQRTISIRLQDLDQNPSTLQSVSSQAAGPRQTCRGPAARYDLRHDARSAGPDCVAKVVLHNRFTPYPQA